MLNNCEFFVTGKNIKIKQVFISFGLGRIVLAKMLKISYSKRV